MDRLADVLNGGLHLEFNENWGVQLTESHGYPLEMDNEFAQNLLVQLKVKV